MAKLMHFFNQILGRSTEVAPSRNCYILTGIPRAGTTLTCKLLSEQEQVAGLNEPIPFRNLQSRQDGVDRIYRSFARFRESLIRDASAPVRGRDGKITDNHFEREKGGDRKRVIKRTEVEFEQSFRTDFKLFIKHNAVFTLLLEDLRRAYPCFAVVRNPLALLGSWSTVSVPVSRGKIRYLSLLDPEAQSALEKRRKLLDRQLFLLDYYFKAYSALPGQQVLRYEDLIASNGGILANIMGQPYDPKTALFSKNKGEVYARDHMLKCGSTLLADEAHYCWHFYDRTEVEALYLYYERQA
ncbi:hypothetical protein [Phaeodactylibacter sp.]|uniref:hypothetical protein n=1 Tax=Phaeodactylibacter sp. TaxID=1940289 RepID=UPI0025EEA681|nr:hypothetical protein [Phaeodactylibacter sp.]MCI4650962.1 sulfotransferase [Phaeodactylibacter sp.]MCI5092367.1 sulfotransferase [Phaeodactylibacter sp.]